MNILLTGIAGFIGSHVAELLLKQGYNVVGIDNLNDYYDPKLKLARLKNLGIELSGAPDSTITSAIHPGLRFILMDIADDAAVDALFVNGQFETVIHLAAQAGARDSVNHPRNYISSNISGFLNILEGCRLNKVRHLVYASSSSVYGLNGKVPFSEHDAVGHPVSLYAATKRSDELMAHTYSHLYGLPTTGLRLFTVYGPWGRPDMAPYLFIDAIFNDRELRIFNQGEMLRDFTYIDDVAKGIVEVLSHIPVGNENWDPQNPDQASSKAPFRVLNIGNSSPVKLMDFIKCIEAESGKEAHKIFLPMQKGDVSATFSDSSELHQLTGFIPSTPINLGVAATIDWYLGYNS